MEESKQIPGLPRQIQGQVRDRAISPIAELRKTERMLRLMLCDIPRQTVREAAQLDLYLTCDNRSSTGQVQAIYHSIYISAWNWLVYQVLYT